jgi:hypothetical protein
MAALLAITPTTGRVRRYARNVHGKVWVTHEAVIEEGYLNADAMPVLRDFLAQPLKFPKVEPTEAA